MTENKPSIEIAVAIISEFYHLDAEAVARMMENFGCITPEQRERVGIIYSALQAKEMFDNRMKGVKL